MPLPEICSSASSHVVISWVVLFFLAIGIRVIVPLGEIVCSILLVFGTTFAFTCWNGPNISAVEIEGEQSNSTSEDDSNDGIDTIETAAAATAAATIDNPIETTAGTRISTTTKRLPFLDNLKTFLTSLVVTHHVACAFGGCGDGSWYLIVGEDGPPVFRCFIKTLTLLNQSYFMSLFFFISAYFVPSTFARAGGWNSFRRTKQRRILIPALFVFFVVSPLAIIISGKWVYWPNTGPAWFLFWLLLFNLIYISFSPHLEWGRLEYMNAVPAREDIGNPAAEQTIQGPLELLLPNQVVTVTPPGTSASTAETMSVAGPILMLSTTFRVTFGIGICGLALIPFLLLQLGSFASMPVSVGSLTCDFFMFILGVMANRFGWFEKPLTEQLDIHPILLACFVVIEGIAIATMGTDAETWGLLLVIVAGIFCLDMSLFLLVVFQRWANFETKVTRFLARGAYGVYLLHPIIVTGVTQVYLHLPFDGIREQNRTYFYPLGFVFVVVISQILTWSSAYALAMLPCLKTIL